jgi:hypothetical protein
MQFVILVWDSVSTFYYLKGPAFKRIWETLHINSLAVGVSLIYDTCATILALPNDAGILALCRSLSWTFAVCITWILTWSARAQIHLASASSEEGWAITEQVLSCMITCSCSSNIMETMHQKGGGCSLAVLNIIQKA